MDTTTYRAVAIINADSGIDRNEARGQQLRQICLEHGISCKVEEVSAGTDIEAVVRVALAEGAEMVLAGGGDGTLRGVAQALAGTSTRMAVLPVGTLNHFARDLEVPLDFAEAAEIAATGVPVDVDVAEAGGRVFINNAVIGLYPAYRSQKDRHEAHGWGSRVATVFGMLATAWRYPSLRVRFDANGAEMTRRTPYVLIGNNEHAMEGSRPWERNSLTEGKLFVYILRDGSRLAFVRILINILLGRLHRSDEFEMIRTSTVTIQARKRRLRVSLDGEIFTLQSPVTFRSRGRALRVMVPVGSKRAREGRASFAS